MGVLEANAILKEIHKLDLSSIFRLWLEAGRIERDLMKQGAIALTLAQALQEEAPSPEFLEQMRQFIADSSNSQRERLGLLGILSYAATKETVDIVLQAASTLSDAQAREAAITGVGRVGRLGGGREKLSPSLERVWHESHDQNLLIFVAVAMAEVGTPSGIEQLLSAALATDGRDEVRARAARGALPKVYTNNAVPPLATRLTDQPPTSEPAKLVAPILVKIGDATAGKAVINWLQGTGENATPLIRDLIVQRTTNPAMSAAWKAALDPAAPFRNEQNREAIRAGLDERKAGIKHEIQ